MQEMGKKEESFKEKRRNDGNLLLKEKLHKIFYRSGHSSCLPPFNLFLSPGNWRWNWPNLHFLNLQQLPFNIVFTLNCYVNWYKEKCQPEPLGQFGKIPLHPSRVRLQNFHPLLEYIQIPVERNS
jgi:hypothetical protein